MSERRQARIQWSSDLLTAVLKMPDGTRIRGIDGGDLWRGYVTFVVEHPDLPVVSGDQEPPLIDPTVEYRSEQYIWHWNAERNE